MCLSGIYQLWICEQTCIRELMRMRHKIVNLKDTMCRCVHGSGILIHPETHGIGRQSQGSISLSVVSN